MLEGDKVFFDLVSIFEICKMINVTRFFVLILKFYTFQKKKVFSDIEL